MSTIFPLTVYSHSVTGTHSYMNNDTLFIPSFRTRSRHRHVYRPFLIDPHFPFLQSLLTPEFGFSDRLPVHNCPSLLSTKSRFLLLFQPKSVPPTQRQSWRRLNELRWTPVSPSKNPFQLISFLKGYIWRDKRNRPVKTTRGGDGKFIKFR